MISEEILKTTTFLGYVESVDDPDKKQRLKIRIPYLHGTIDQIPTENLPWAQPHRNMNGFDWKIPSVNKIINVTFPTGDLYYPEYNNVQHLDVNLQNKIESLNSDDYSSFISICYNYNTQIFMSKTEGLNIFHKKSGMIIDNNGNVITRLNGNKSLYKIGDEDASQSMILGNNMLDYLDILIDALYAPYIGNNGINVIPTPNMVNVLNKYKAIRKDLISNNAFISENKAISENNIETDIYVGDTFTIESTNNTLNTVVDDLKQKEIKEEKKDEYLQNKVKEEIKDEKINNDEGLINNEKEYKSTIDSIVLEDTTVIETQEEVTSEPEFDEVDYENEGFQFGNNNEEQFTEDNEDFEFNFDGDDSGLFQAQSGDNIIGTTPVTGGNIVSGGTSSGKKINAKKISSNIGPKDYSVLPKPGYVSQFLTLNQVLYSDTAKKKGIKNEVDNQEHLLNLMKVSQIYFDTAFKYFKENFNLILLLNSGYRGFDLNEAVGGSSSSQHKTGSAIDIILVDSSGNRNKRYNNLLFYYLKHKFNFFGQLIWEDNFGDGPKWCHISLNNGGKEGQIFTAEGGTIKAPSQDTLQKLKSTGIWDSKKDPKFN